MAGFLYVGSGGGMDQIGICESLSDHSVENPLEGSKAGVGRPESKPLYSPARNDSRMVVWMAAEVVEKEGNRAIQERFQRRNCEDVMIAWKGDVYLGF